MKTEKRIYQEIFYKTNPHLCSLNRYENILKIVFLKINNAAVHYTTMQAS